MSFLPDDYREPVTSNYMAFDPGENTFRVLSDASIGWEYWKTVIKDGKSVRGPIRIKGMEAPRLPITEFEVNPKTGNLDTPSLFWAFVVYNRNAEKVQILEIKQSGIRKALLALAKSKSWGDITKFDITITKVGQGKETEYSVMPCPKEPLDDGIKQLYKDMNINLEALFANNGLGADPFNFATETIDTAKIAEEMPF